MASRYPTPVARIVWSPEPLSQFQREIDRVFDDVFGSGASIRSDSGEGGTADAGGPTAIAAGQSSSAGR